MKFYGSLGEIQVRCNFLVGQALHQAGEHFFFPARELELAVDGVSCLQQRSRFFTQPFQGLVFGLHHDHVIARRLASHHAMHRQEPCGLINWKAAVRTCLDMKVRHSRVLFVEEVNIARKCRAGIRQLMRLLTSADNLHMHPLRMRPGAGTKAVEFSILCPSTRRVPQIGYSVKQEAVTAG